MEKYVIVLTTTEIKEDAEKIADTLLEKCLTTCVQIIGPMTSKYRWKDKMEKVKEFLCIIKTRKRLYKQVEKAIKEVHPYKIPEIIEIPITSGIKDYFSWLDREIK